MNNKHPLVQYFAHRFKLHYSKTPLRFIPEKLEHIAYPDNKITVQQISDNIQRIQPVTLSQMKDYSRLGENELDSVWFDRCALPLVPVICMFPGLQRHPLQQRIESLGEMCVMWQGSGFFNNREDVIAALSMTILNHRMGHFVVGPVDFNYLNTLAQEKIPHALVVPDRDMRNTFRRILAAQPNNNRADIARFFDGWDKTIDFFEEHLKKHSEDGLVVQYPLSIRNKEISVREIPAVFAVSSGCQYYKLALKEYGTGTLEIKLQDVKTEIEKPQKVNKKALQKAMKKSRKEAAAANATNVAQPA